MKAGLGTALSVGAVAVAAVLWVRFDVSVGVFELVFETAFLWGMVEATGAVVENGRVLLRHCIVPRARLGIMVVAVER